MIETRDTTATETGEAVMAICEATEATAIGRSGRIPFLMAISEMIGNMVYTTCPVPHRNVRVQVVKGASSVMCCGWRRSSRSAYCIITFKPPAVCNTEAQPITARIVSITSTGGLPGSNPNIKHKRNKPIPLIRPSPIPPNRVPTNKQIIIIKNCKVIMIVPCQEMKSS